MRVLAVLCAASGLMQSTIAADDALRPPLRVDVVQLTLIEQVEVAAPEEGVLREVAVREGGAVQTGALLARLDDVESRLACERAEIELKIATENARNDVRVRLAKKSLEVARAELKRAEESREKYSKSISETELDRLRLLADRAVLESEQAELDAKTAELNRQLKQNALEQAKYQVDRRSMRSPLAGVVVQVNRRPGEWVQPGDKIMRLVRTDRLRAEGFLKNADLASDPTGRPVTLIVDLPGRAQAEFPGVVQFVSPEVNPVNGQVRFWAEIENAQNRLHPGMEATLVIRPSE